MWFLLLVTEIAVQKLSLTLRSKFSIMLRESSICNWSTSWIGILDVWTDIWILWLGDQDLSICGRFVVDIQDILACRDEWQLVHCRRVDTRACPSTRLVRFSDFS